MALISGRYPFESLPRRCVRLEDAEKSLATMAGERIGVSPVVPITASGPGRPGLITVA